MVNNRQNTIVDGKEKGSGKVVKKSDLILLGVLLLLGLGTWGFWNLTKTEGSELQVFVDNKLYKTFQLSENTVFTIEHEDGGFNTFEIRDGLVDMTDASCPDQICVKERKAQYKDDTITCLPNKVILKVAGGEESEVDITAK